MLSLNSALTFLLVSAGRLQVSLGDVHGETGTLQEELTRSRERRHTLLPIKYTQPVRQLRLLQVNPAPCVTWGNVELHQSAQEVLEVLEAALHHWGTLSFSGCSRTGLESGIGQWRGVVIRPRPFVLNKICKAALR